MKKLFMTFFAVAALSFVMVSCGEKKDESASTDESKDNQETKANDDASLNDDKSVSYSSSSDYEGYSDYDSEDAEENDYSFDGDSDNDDYYASSESDFGGVSSSSSTSSDSGFATSTSAAGKKYLSALESYVKKVEKIKEFTPSQVSSLSSEAAKLGQAAMNLSQKDFTMADYSTMSDYTIRLANQMERLQKVGKGGASSSSSYSSSNDSFDFDSDSDSDDDDEW